MEHIEAVEIQQIVFREPATVQAVAKYAMEHGRVNVAAVQREAGLSRGAVRAAIEELRRSLKDHGSW